MGIRRVPCIEGANATVTRLFCILEAGDDRGLFTVQTDGCSQERNSQAYQTCHWSNTGTMA